MSGKNILYLILVSLLICVSVWWLGAQYPSSTSSKQKDIEAKITPEINTEQVKSSDGTAVLVHKTSRLGSVVTHSLTTQTKQKSIIIFETSANADHAITLPRNAWSPDNKYLFVSRNTPQGMDFLVFRSDGSSFKNDQKYLNISELWQKTKMALRIHTLTGWASEDLIVVYTSTPEGNQGPSYWFVVSSQQFMQLSS